ncbi:aldo/keto reductase [Amycolatopsis jiangsuensis]|uniref:Aryl-alcohol dehydrogenase (NADP+) n=1 Tax=Amycolatopsis jiangsuensis TaxID=1181879 RepID=A0A840IZI3_9PSEU|nr:aldo/keto reductase [Amycolatopsis jiangsuensis]MBB4686825.1 aryl-alcohol dehydrogenase (NADP+) [Amycolatopsis jiangsuensis]
MAQLGHTGIDVFPLALGGNTFGWTSDEAASHAVLDAFVEGGGNFVDTSDNYSAFAPGNSGGESETIIGSWLAARKNRDRVVIGTKVGLHPEFEGLAPENVAAAADASLKRLGTDYIDVYYAHVDDEKVPLADTAGAFEQLRKAGKIRTVALSNYTGARIGEWLEIARREGYELPAVLQPDYNLVKRLPYERDVAPAVAEAGLAVVPYFGLASGFLTGKYRKKEDFGEGVREYLATQFFSESALAVLDVLEEVASAHEVEMATAALAWLRGRPGVSAPIASARTPEQLPALLASAEVEFTAAETAALDEVSARVEERPAE